VSTRSKSTLFLIEQLIVVAVFAICAVACISILTSAFFFAHDSSDTSRALIEAQNSAEIFKATGGDFEAVADLMGGAVNVDGYNRPVLRVFYDRHWQTVAYEQIGGFVLNIEGETPLAPGDFQRRAVMGELSVSRVAGDSLIAFPVAARVNLGVAVPNRP